ncbi:MAG TPA: DUF916 domain-containing protein [Candidatus Saccharimonadales bacterium]|nr:DUF916 domain-containing protein [Candidatus Saccharimonadales bacterium]
MRRRTSAGLGSSLLAGLVLVLSAVLSPLAAAATSGSAGGNGLKISPVSTNITVNPGQSQTVTVNVQNVTQAPVTLQVFINDFTASGDESGTPALLLNPNQYAPSHSLKRYVAPVPNVTLAAGQEKSVGVTITIPSDAPGGGYYGAVRFAPASSGGSGSVALSASVASLILVRVPGDFKEDLQLTDMSVQQGDNGSSSVVFTSSKNLVAAIRFKNDGDVQEQPFGKLLLKQGKKQLASFEINNTTPRGNVLPDSVRKFTVSLSHIGMFGKYTLEGNFGFGQDGQLLSGQTTFYVIPIWGILGVLAVILIILFFIFGFPRLMRGYNQRVVRRATRR